MTNFQGKLSVITTISSSTFVEDGSMAAIRCIFDVYILIRSLKTRAN